MRSSVDLPPPLGPSTPIRAPAASSRSSPSSTRRPPKVFASPRAERRGTLAMSRPASGGGRIRGKAGSTRIHGRATPHPHPRRRPRGPRAGRPRRRRRTRPARARRRARVARRAPRRAAGASRTPCAGSSSPRPASSSGCAPARSIGDRAWTSATGAFGLPVAEHALALMLAADRAIHAFARANARGSADGRHDVRSLEGSTRPDRRRGRDRPRADRPAGAVRRRGDRGHAPRARRARRRRARWPPTASARSGARRTTS